MSFFLHTYWLLIPELYRSFCYAQVYYIYVFFIEGFSTDETEAKVGHWDYFITWWQWRNEQVKLLININIYNNTYDPFTAWMRNYLTNKHSITVWIKSFNKKCNKGTLLKKFHVVIPKLILKFFICNYYQLLRRVRGFFPTTCSWIFRQYTYMFTYMHVHVFIKPKKEYLINISKH